MSETLVGPSCGCPRCDDLDCTTGFGLCHCGCGGETRRALRTNRSRGRYEVKGQPMYWIPGHNQVGTRRSPETRAKIAAAKLGSRNPSWRGGRSVNSCGYVQIKNREHPAAGAKGYVTEHRLVMERMLGRYLTGDESVHHINGDKQDNRPENLQLRTGRHGKGASHMCGDCGSINVVAVEI